MVTRRVFTKEFKVEAVRLVKEQGLSIAQACRDLVLHDTVLRKWIKDQESDPENAFPGRGVQKPDTAEVAALRKEIAKLKMERDILKKAAAWFAKESMCNTALWRSIDGSARSGCHASALISRAVVFTRG
jgi:transposase